MFSRIGVLVSYLDLRSMSRMIGSQGGSSGRLRLRPRDGGSKKEGSGTVASVTLDRSPRSRLGLCPRARASTSLSTEEGDWRWDVGRRN